MSSQWNHELQIMKPFPVPKREGNTGQNRETSWKENWYRYRGQIDVYGADVVSEVVNLKVLIIGLNGVGAEVAKTLALEGVGSLFLNDDSLVTIRDLGVNFLLSEDHVGRSKSSACLDQLKTLGHGTVKVEVIKGSVKEAELRNVDIVIDCSLNMNEAISLNNLCHKVSSGKRKVKYLKAGVHGLTGYAFADFGGKFKCRHRMGKVAARKMVKSVSFSSLGKGISVELVDLQQDPLQLNFNGRIFFRFSNLKGDLGEMLNHEDVFEISAFISPYHFLATSPNGYSYKPGKYTGQGVIEVIREDIEMKHFKLETTLDMILSGNGKQVFNQAIKNQHALHLGLTSIWHYEVENGIPRANHEEDVLKMKQIARELVEAHSCDEEIDERRMDIQLRLAECQFQPLCTVLGGFVSMEVLKTAGFGQPISQWVHFDMTNTLPFESNEARTDTKPIGSRYDDFIMMFGTRFHSKVLRSKVLMAGYNNTGSEIVKLFGLVGVGCSPEGRGLVAAGESATVGASDVSCHRLVEGHFLDSPQILAASKMAAKINSCMTFIGKHEKYQLSASPFYFGSGMFAEADVILALGDRDDRNSAYKQSLLHEKPIIECRNSRAEFSTLVSVPHLTRVNKPEEVANYCHFRNANRFIKHGRDECLESSKLSFELEFENCVKLVTKFSADPSGWISEVVRKTFDTPNKRSCYWAIQSKIRTYEQVLRFLLRWQSEEDAITKCVTAAYSVFNERFHEAIAILQLYKLGVHERLVPAVFDITDDLHLNYIVAHADLLAVAFCYISPGESLFKDLESARSIISAIISTKPEGFIESSDHKLNRCYSGRMDTEPLSMDEEIERFELLLDQLRDLGVKNENFYQSQFQPLDWKALLQGSYPTDVSECCLDFLVAASNLRARNFGLDEMPRYVYRLALDGVEPTLAPIAAVSAGLGVAEVLKSLQYDKPIEHFSEYVGDMLHSKLERSQPIEPERAQDKYDQFTLSYVYAKPQGFTEWDKTVIRGGDLTLREFLEAFKEKTGLNCVTLFHPDAAKPSSKGRGQFIFSQGQMFLSSMRRKFEQRMDQKLSKILEEVYGLHETACGSDAFRVPLECMAANDNDDEYEIPTIDYYF